MRPVFVPAAVVACAMLYGSSTLLPENPKVETRTLSMEELCELNPLDNVTDSPDHDHLCATLNRLLKTALPSKSRNRLLNLRAYEFLRSGEFPRALADVTEAVKSEPDNKEYRLTALIAKAPNERIIEDIRDLFDETDSEVLGFGSYICWQRRRNEAAWMLAKKALALDPENPTAFFTLGMLNGEVENFIEALDAFDKCIKYGGILPARPGSCLPFFHRGMILLEDLEKPKRALPDLLTASRLNPEYHLLKLGMASYYLRQGSRRIACSIIESLLKDRPADLKVLSRAVPILLLAGKDRKAMEVSEKLISIRPDLLTSYAIRAEVHFGRGAYYECLADLEKACSIRRASVAKAFLLATCPDDKLRDGERALAIAEDTVQWTKGTNFRHLMLLAIAQAECGDFKRAVQNAKQAIQKAPENDFQKQEYLNRLRGFERGEPYRLRTGKIEADFLFF